MRPDDPSRSPDPANDDIEILEVVGLDDDMPPPSGVEDDAAEDEIEVRFEDGAEPAAVAPAPAGSDPGDRERVLRLQAEFENFKRRVDREKADFYRHATSDLVERLLPVVDNFDRALLHAHEDPREAGPFLDGVDLIHKQLLEVLTKHGLSPVETADRPFDPEVHEAVATEETDDVPVNTVLAELQRGYRFHGRLLRPAMVKVSVAPEESGDARSATTIEHDGEA
jgi:molecular chaperone GrpE (heat shock protein)